MGWARVTSLDNSRIETTTLFQQRSGGLVVAEAGVFSSHLFTRSVLPALRQGSVANTGIAFANPSPTTSMTIYLRLLDENGTELSTSQIVLAPYNQVARFITDYFSTVPSNFEGSVEAKTFLGSTPPASPLRASAWIDNFNFTFNTFTWVPGIRGDFAKESLFAHVADSGGYKTTFRFVNLSSSAQSTVKLRLFTPTGAAWAVLPGPTPSEYTATIPALGAAFVQTTGNRSQTEVGWALVTNDDLIGTPERIETFNGTQVTSQVGAEPYPRLRKFRLFAEYNGSAGVNTGIAFANPNSLSVTIDMTLYNSAGAVAATRNGVVVGANSQIVQHLDQWFPGISATSGTVVGTVTNPGVSVNTLQANNTQSANFPVIF